MNQVNDILKAIGRAGRNEDGSYTRACYSPEYFEAVDITEAMMREYGMETSRDAAGNLRGVLRGSEPGLKSIIIGSHLDTVPSGGLFDGAYGVAGGLEVARRFKEKGEKPRHTIELYAFNAEESSPLGGTFGSRCMVASRNRRHMTVSDCLSAARKLGCRQKWTNSRSKMSGLVMIPRFPQLGGIGPPCICG